MSALADDTVSLCHELLRIDTTNPGQAERPAAEYVATKLSDAGLEGTFYESEPGRATYVARIEGDGSETEALVIHGHLDVVPAVAADWSHHPFSGELADGCLWGRGAVDMKDMVAMMTAVARRMAAEKVRPRRDLIFVYFADEEAAGSLGAGYMAEHHPEAFEGATAAIGEVGGYSVTVRPGLRLYPVQVAEKGLAWMRLRARGRAGHGSAPHSDNPVVKLAEAVARLGRAQAPIHLTAVTEAFLREVCALLDVEYDASDIEATLARLGPEMRFVKPVLRNTISPTMLEAGQKVNVIPSAAEAMIDGRFLPGHEEGFLAEVDALLGEGITREMVSYGRPVEAPWDHPLVRAMCRVLLEADPEGHPLPYMLGGGTDAKYLSRLGMDCYGFVPLRLPADLNFGAMFHGVDERIPVDALSHGVETLWQLLTTY